MERMSSPKHRVSVVSNPDNCPTFTHYIYSTVIQIQNFPEPYSLEGFETFEFCLHFKVILLSLLFRFVYYCTAVQQQMDVDFSIEMPGKKKEIFYHFHFHFIPFSMYLLNK